MTDSAKDSALCGNSDKLAAEITEIQSIFDSYGFPEEFLCRFDQLECLAHHRYSETYLVRSRSSGELCVAKCYSLAEYDFADPDEILSRLDHPGIPKSKGSFRNDSMICFVREYAEGTALDRYAADNDLTRNEVIRVCIELAEILSFLHRQDPPVIHRDIKPENIVIREDGSICLIDFDIARTFKERGESDTVFFGTRGYAAPEQYGFSQTDRRSDIYSFGVLLRFLLTDSVRANDKVKLYRPLQRVIDRCTAFAPEKRYSDIDEAILDLENANPRSQLLRFGHIAVLSLLITAVACFGGFKIYEKATYSPYKDGSIVPLVTPDEERQDDAIRYMQDKYNTHIFDDKDEYMTIGMTREVLIQAFGLDASYVEGGNPADPPDESPDWFFPWSLDDAQYIDKDQIEYVVTKLYWPDVAADWTVLKEDTGGRYPGIVVSEKWCEDHDIDLGVNRPKELSRGEAAIAFANADRVYEAMKDLEFSCNQTLPGSHRIYSIPG